MTYAGCSCRRTPTSGTRRRSARRRRRPSSWTGCDPGPGGSSSARTPTRSTPRCARSPRPLTTTPSCSARWPQSRRRKHPERQPSRYEPERRCLSMPEVKDPFCVAERDLLPVDLADRRGPEEAAGHLHRLERAARTEQDVVGPDSLHRREQGQRRADTARNDIEVLPQVLRRLVPVELDAVVMVKVPARVESPEHER